MVSWASHTTVHRSDARFEQRRVPPLDRRDHVGSRVLILVLRKCWYGLLAIVLTVPGGMLFHHLIQIIVHRHRPFRHSEFLDLGGYSFPSGHTMAATLLYGLLAVFAILVWKTGTGESWPSLGPFWPLPSSGLSRIALGAHYLTDVLGAIVGGASWLILCMMVVEWTRRRRVGG